MTPKIIPVPSSAKGKILQCPCHYLTKATTGQKAEISYCNTAAWHYVIIGKEWVCRGNEIVTISKFLLMPLAIGIGQQCNILKNA